MWLCRNGSFLLGGAIFYIGAMRYLLLPGEPFYVGTALPPFAGGSLDLTAFCRFSFPVSSHIYHMDSIDWNYQNVIQYERNTSYA